MESRGHIPTSYSRSFSLENFPHVYGFLFDRFFIAPQRGFQCQRMIISLESKERKENKGKSQHRGV